MSLFYILESILNLSYFFIFGVVTLIVMELCLRLTFAKKKNNKSFWRSSLIIGIAIFCSFYLGYYIDLRLDITARLYDGLPFLGFFIGIGTPLLIGLIIGYIVAARLDSSLSKKSHSLSVILINILTTFILSLFLGTILCMMLFISASNVGGQIIRTSYGTFHVFNQHVRNACLNATCPRDIADIRDFDRKRFDYLHALTSIQYQRLGEHEFIFSVRFTPKRIMGSSHESDLLVNTQSEAEQKGLWR